MTQGRPPPFPMTLMSGLSRCPVEGGAGTEPQALLAAAWLRRLMDCMCRGGTEWDEGGGFWDSPTGGRAGGRGEL